MDRPLVLAGGLTPGNVAGANPCGAAVRGRRKRRGGERPGTEGRPEHGAVHEGGGQCRSCRTSRLRTGSSAAIPTSTVISGPTEGHSSRRRWSVRWRSCATRTSATRRTPNSSPSWTRSSGSTWARPSPVVLRAPVVAGHRGGARMYLKREDLNHTGGAQGEQHRGPGAARQTDGQDPHHRGDRRRPAWSGGRDGRGAARTRVRRLHGSGGHPAPGPQRLSHETPRRQGGVGGIRLQDPQGRPQRGDAGLGEQRRRHLLHHRDRGPGPASPIR